MENKLSFGKFIAEKRKEKGMTQAEVAEKLFITVTAVSKWERGVTYPDITIISSLCEILGITEHELITASNDNEYRSMKKDAHKYKIVSNSYFWGFTISYAVTLLACFIANLAVNHKLSWFFIVLTGLMTAFSLVPSCLKFVSKHKCAWVSLTFLGSLILLFLACAIYTGGDWFIVATVAVLFSFAVIMLPIYIKLYSFPKWVKSINAVICVLADTVLLALLLMVTLNGNSLKIGFQIALFCAIPFLVTAFIASLKRLNRQIKVSISFVVWGIFVFVINRYISFVYNQPYEFKPNLMSWRTDVSINSNIITITTAVAFLIALIFLIFGIRKKK